MAEKKQNKNEQLTPAKNVEADILLPRIFFILSTLTLILFGWIMVFSASSVEAINNNQSPFDFLLKQAGLGAVGIFIAIFIWRRINFSFWKSNAVWVLAVALAILMLITMFAGTDILGARRWIMIGPVSLQPSEYAKIILVLIVARYFAEYNLGHISSLKFLGIVGGVTIGLVAFILLGQKDLGTSMICIIGVLAVLYIAGLPMPWFVFLVAVVIGGGILVVAGTAWRSDRLVFLDPYNDGAEGYGAGYQLIRSWYAFAQGGLGGLGLGNSFEKFQYLPEAETDFIFSIVGEELGFFGCLFVLAVFLVFLVSGLMIALRSRNRFGASASGAFVIMIVFQAAINIFCVIGFLPTTGKPLPFISYGGSSLIASLIMVGIVLAASEEDAKPDVYQKRRSSFKVGFGKKVEDLIPSNVDRKLGDINALKKMKKGETKSQRKNSSSSRKRTNNNSDIRKNRSAQIKKTAINKTSPRLKVAKQKIIKEPGFIADNKKSKGKSSSTYTYKRPKANPNFKPRVSSFSQKQTDRPSVKKNSKMTGAKRPSTRQSAKGRNTRSRKK